MSETGTRNGEDSGMSTGRHIIVALMVLGVVGCGGDDSPQYNYYTPDREWTQPAQLTADSPTVYYDREIPVDYRPSLHEIDRHWREVQECVGETASPPDVYWVHGTLESPPLPSKFGVADLSRNHVYMANADFYAAYKVLRHEFVHIILFQNGDPESGRNHAHWAFDECRS